MSVDRRPTNQSPLSRALLQFSTNTVRFVSQLSFSIGCLVFAKTMFSTLVTCADRLESFQKLCRYWSKILLVEEFIFLVSCYWSIILLVEEFIFLVSCSLSRESSFLKTGAYPPFFQSEGQWHSLKQELNNVVRSVANSVAPHLWALGGMESQPVAFYGFQRVALPLFCPFLSNALRYPHLATKPETTATQARARLKHMNAKALVL